MFLLLSIIILGPTAIIFLLILGALGSIMESWHRWVLKQFKKQFKKQPQKVTDKPSLKTNIPEGSNIKDIIGLLLADKKLLDENV